MIVCVKCGSSDWKVAFICPVNPANDKFHCHTCGHDFHRYDPVIKSETKVVKVGKKKKHLAVPEGWSIVTVGTVIPGDMFANVEAIRWNYVESDDINNPVEFFECVIRRTRQLA